MKITITFLVLLLSIVIAHAQTIEFSFENAQNTNDGSNDFYEVDVMIATSDGLADFKLGSGLLYFRFNDLAFGTYINNEGGIEYEYPEGFIIDQGVDAAPGAKIYGSFVKNDNQSNVTTWSFRQIFSSSTFANNNVTATPTKLCRLKFKYLDVGQPPMVEFVTDIDQGSDQFYTACGDDEGGGAFTGANCISSPGEQIVGASYINTGATLSTEDVELDPFNIKVYPNPATNIVKIKSSIPLQKIALFNLLGEKVLETTETTELDISKLSSGIYMLNLYSKEVRAIYVLKK